MAAVGGMQRLVHGGGTRRQLHNDSRSCSTLVPAATAHPLPRLTLMPWSLPFSSRYLNCFRPSITPQASRMVCAGSMWGGEVQGSSESHGGCWLGCTSTGRQAAAMQEGHGHWDATEVCATADHGATCAAHLHHVLAGVLQQVLRQQQRLCSDTSVRKRPRLGINQQCVQQCAVTRCGTVRPGSASHTGPPPPPNRCRPTATAAVQHPPCRCGATGRAPSQSAAR